VTARLIALFSQPEDAGAFDRHYREVHAPIVLRYPRLRELRLTRVEPIGPRSAAYHLMAEMFFDSRADLDAALASEPGIESGRDLRNFATAGVTLYAADDARVEIITPGTGDADARA
jgi:uncharacterized protein (TIGR02118 family)